MPACVYARMRMNTSESFVFYCNPQCLAIDVSLSSSTHCSGSLENNRYNTFPKVLVNPCLYNWRPFPRDHEIRKTGFLPHRHACIFSSFFFSFLCKDFSSNGNAFC